MLFSDPIFFLFFSSYFLFHQFLPRHFMMGLVVLGSAVFYGYWNPLFIPLPFVFVIFTYWAGLQISGSENAPSKKKHLLVFVSLLFFPLILFKYLGFLVQNIKLVTPSINISTPNLPLPLGISFITFTSAAYLIDVYRGKFKAENNFSYLLSAVFFFPHLIAGPIVRPIQLMPQLKHWNPQISAKIKFGLLLFSIGLFKKLVFADSIATHVNQAYSSLSNSLSVWPHLMAFYGFTLQIYCDFSGYTDMALGLSWVLGIRLPGNFNSPYISTSIVEFWKRWHITLSTWLRDYLYIPLGGNRWGWLNQMRNITLTMALGGLWHGASWTFVLWGLFHSFGIVCNHSMHRFLPKFKIPKVICWTLTLHFVAVGWVLFRAPKVIVALELLKGLLMKSWSFNLFPTDYFYGVAIFICFVLTHRIDKHSIYRLWSMRLPKFVIYAIALFLIGVSFIMSSGNSAEFIYFDF